MKGSLGINFSYVFFQILLDDPFSYMFAHDLMFDYSHQPDANS